MIHTHYREEEKVTVSTISTPNRGDREGAGLGGVATLVVTAETVVMVTEDHRAVIMAIENHLKTKRGRLKTKGDRLKTKGGHLKTKRDHLKTKRDHLKTKGSHLKTKGDHLKTKRDRLKTKRDHLKTKRDRLKTKGDHLKTKGGHLKTKRDHLKTKGSHLRTAVETDIEIMDIRVDCQVMVGMAIQGKLNRILQKN